MCLKTSRKPTKDDPKTGIGYTVTQKCVESGQHARDLKRGRYYWTTHDHIKKQRVRVYFVRKQKGKGHTYNMVETDGHILCVRFDGRGHDGGIENGPKNKWYIPPEELYLDKAMTSISPAYETSGFGHELPPMGKWETDENQGYIKSDFSRAAYPAGFHLFLKKEDAEKSPLGVGNRRRAIIQVEWKRPVAFGRQFDSDCVVVRDRRPIKVVKTRKKRRKQ